MKCNISTFCCMAMLLAPAACDKGGGEAPETPEPEQPMTRPVELVTDTYRAYPSGENACVDSYLTLTFSSEPVPGTSGEIRIVDEDGKVADRILMADIAAVAGGKPKITAGTTFTTAMDAVGSSAAGYYRIVYYNAFSIDGAVDGGYTVTIRPHSDRLEYGGTYSVEIDREAIIADRFFVVLLHVNTCNCFAKIPDKLVNAEI